MQQLSLQNKQNPLVLTFDVGTQSARVMLVDKKGNILCKAQKSYEKPYVSPHPDWAEQDPNFYWNTMCEVSLQLKETHEELWNDIIAVTCTCIRATTICLDKDGNALRNAVVWLDKRKATDLPPMPWKNAAAFKVAGLSQVAETLRSQLAANWIIKNQPDIWHKTYKFVLLSTYFNFKFCGSMKDSCANMCGVLPYDSKTRNWLGKNDIRRAVYLMEDDKLVDLVSPGEIIGNITKQTSEATGIPEGLPFVVTGSDKACETFGLSCDDESSAAISLGTTATIEVHTNRYFPIKSVLPPYTSLTSAYLPEMETFRGYWLISWFKKEFASKEVEEAQRLGCSAEALLNERLREIPAGCNGLVMQPTFTPDAITPHAKGSIIGFSDVHTRIHLYRAIIEGIGFSLMEGLEFIEKTGKLKVKKIFVAGGGSNSSEICQITADMMGLPVYRIQTHEVCGLGSSILAFVTMGIYKDAKEAQQTMVKIKDEFLPNEKEHQTYLRLYSEVYCKIFDNLVHLYENLNDIIKNDTTKPIM
ncbi:MAG: FGGY-family carbohydrate kinase [Oscillospiraceae bacterium]